MTLPMLLSFRDMAKTYTKFAEHFLELDNASFPSVPNYRLMYHF
jgi:hypothetical protein